MIEEGEFIHPRAKEGYNYPVFKYRIDVDSIKAAQYLGFDSIREYMESINIYFYKKHKTKGYSWSAEGKLYVNCTEKIAFKIWKEIGKDRF
jgi:hypothetical protein